ncbi:MAG: LCP family protein [Candidatus Marinimicrobia bacterium]|nr:LCP family protein [Candidatus Neomarinimicrobiota bacterium]
MTKKEKILIILAAVLFVLGVMILAYWFFFKKDSPLINPLPEMPTESRFNFEVSPAPKGQFNFLLLGIGDPSHEGSNLTDSIMVLHLDTNQKTASLIFIPRDLWVGYKINEAYSQGGLKLAKEAVSFVTGLPIEKAILIDFNGFVQAIDSLGGIEVTVAQTFDDYYYPVQGKELELCGKPPEEVAQLSATLSGFELEKQFPCRFEHLHFDAGKTHLNGATALKFARSRHSAQSGSDFARGARQQAILNGIKDKLLSLGALKKVDQHFKSMVKLVKTDLDLEGAKAIAALIIDPQEYKISQIIPSEENVLVASKSSRGQAILLPKAGENNWDGFRDFIRLFKNTTDF